MPKRVGKYEIHKTLGEGTFGKVKRAMNTETSEWVAIKVLDKEKIAKQNMGAQVKKEISIMKLVRHPHVVQLKEVLASRTKIFIVLELVTGGELFDKIVGEGRFNEDTARFYFQQLVVGTEYCHLQGVCHRDLKPENLLLDGNENLKISDFGLSALYEQGGDSDRATLLHTTCGTPNYVAPEVLADKGYDGAAADTWSIGVILYVFLAGFLPFDEPTMSALFRKIQNAEFSYPSWFPVDVKELLKHLLVVDPAKRWSLAQIQEHPWYNKGGPYGGTRPNKDVKSVEVSEESEMNKDESNVIVVTPSTEVDDVRTSSEIKAATMSGMKKVNAFDLINMCSGSALNRMFSATEEEMQEAKQEKEGEESGPPAHLQKVFLYATSLSEEQIMKVMKRRFQACKGFLSQETYHDGSKLRAIFDLGKGHIHVKVAVKLASEEPLLCLVVLKRARGDLISFREISNQLGDVAVELKGEQEGGGKGDIQGEMDANRLVEESKGGEVQA